MEEIEEPSHPGGPSWASESSPHGLKNGSRSTQAAFEEIMKDFRVFLGVVMPKIEKLQEIHVTEKQEVDSKIKEITHWKEFCNSNLCNLTNKIRLNVGGVSFTTSKDTLLAETSFFSNMLSHGWKPDLDGEYFVDRDPKHFPFILNYLRTRKVKLLSNYKDSETLEELMEEVDFYQIGSLLHILKEAMTESTDSEPDIELVKRSDSEAIKVVDKVYSSSGVFTNLVVYTSKPLAEGIYEWRVQIEDMVQSGSSGFGVVTENQKDCPMWVGTYVDVSQQVTSWGIPFPTAKGDELVLVLDFKRSVFLVKKASQEWSTSIKKEQYRFYGFLYQGGMKSFKALSFKKIE